MVMSNVRWITVWVHDLHFQSSMIISFGSCTVLTLRSVTKKNFLLLLYWIHLVYIFFKSFLNTFLTSFDSWAQLKTDNYFYSSFSHLMQLYKVKYIKRMRTTKYSSEDKCEWNLYYCSWQLPRFISAVLTDWLLPTHSEQWQHFHSVLLFLAVGQTKHLPRRLPPFFCTVRGAAVCFQGTSIAFTALQVCL